MTDEELRDYSDERTLDGLQRRMKAGRTATADKGWTDDDGGRTWTDGRRRWTDDDGRRTQYRRRTSSMGEWVDDKRWVTMMVNGYDGWTKAEVNKGQKITIDHSALIP